MVQVGVRELRGRFGFYLEKVQEGEELVITRRKEPIATITPLERNRMKIGHLVIQGLVWWNHGKPRGTEKLINVPGKSVSRIILEERR